MRGANVLPIPRRHKDAGERKGSVIRDEMLRFRGGGRGKEPGHVDGGGRTDATALFVVRICVDK